MTIYCGFYKTKRAAQIERKWRQRTGHCKHIIEEARKPRCDAECNIQYTAGYTLVQTEYIPNPTR